MNALLDAFWRAAAYCLHPRVILLSLAPLLLAGGLALAMGYFFWEPAVAGVRATLESWSLLAALLKWLDGVGGEGLRALVAPLVILALALPVIVILSLLLVALLMAPALVSLVVRRRFPELQAKHGAAWWQSVLWSLGCTVVALCALVLSLPLWFVPPLVLILPPLIWGWLTCRVMAFDVLAQHASAAERRSVLRQQRWPLLAIGMVCGYLGAAPTLLWALGAATLILAPVLVLVSVWLYTLVFAFAALWFAHFCLAALQQLREAAVPLAAATAPFIPPLIPVTPALPPALP